MPSLVNRRLFITGMGSGIGLATAKLAAAQGARVSGTVQSPEQEANLEGVVSTDLCFRLDVTDEEALGTAVSDAAGRIGGLDGVVASAGIIKLLSSADTDSSDWSRIIDVNLTASFSLARAATPFLLKAESAAMVLISSQIGLVGHQRAAAYAASKAGINGLAKSLALELADRNVRVNAIAPGPIATDMTAATRADPERFETLRSAIPLGRFGTAEEIANLAVFLLSEQAGFITGQVVVADGGFTAR
ncbi:MAG: SDR family oxidoreductase [Pseudomonadota bacterium]|jgi:NAD(P)-dependent dehydrogenase (short-subunit alcohol dehydrogenase family)|nr:SDR family oxidoreductase [Pseudomonadota bacterium]